VRGMLSFILLTCVASLALSARPQVELPSASAERWKSANDAGQRALEQGRSPEAIREFQSAIAEAEKLGWADPRLAGSISGLAQGYLQQGNYAASESLFQRSLGILEKALGPEDPAVAGILNNLAAVYRLRGNYAEATPPARLGRSSLVPKLRRRETFPKPGGLSPVEPTRSDATPLRDERLSTRAPRSKRLADL